MLQIIKILMKYFIFALLISIFSSCEKIGNDINNCTEKSLTYCIFYSSSVVDTITVKCKTYRYSSYDGCNYLFIDDKEFEDSSTVKTTAPIKIVSFE